MDWKTIKFLLTAYSVLLEVVLTAAAVAVHADGVVVPALALRAARLVDVGLWDCATNDQVAQWFRSLHVHVRHTFMYMYTYMYMYRYMYKLCRTHGVKSQNLCTNCIRKCSA